MAIKAASATSLVAAVSARSFTDSVGVTAHIDSGQANWQNTAVLQSEVAYLGVKNMRADAPYSWELPIYTALAQMGVRFSLFEANMYVTGGVVDASVDVQRADALERAVPGSVVSFEGANEYENSNYTLNGQASRGNLAWGALDDAQLQAAVAADPLLAHVPIVAAATLSYETAVPNVGRYVDASNWHVYGGVGEQLANAMATGIAMAHSSAPGAPVYITETGISSSGYGTSDWGVTSEATQGIIDTNAVLDGFADGATKTFLYELMDDTNASVQENNFGLFNSDGSAKPVATDIHNLMTILADDGTGTVQPGALAYGIDGLPSTARTMLLEKSNGTFELVIWNANAVISDGTKDIDPPSSTVTISFDAVQPGISVYDPIQGSAAIRTKLNANAISVVLGKDPLIIEVTPATAAPVVAITSQVLAQDTGRDATDLITANGAVTLTGTLSGATGTSVQVFDQATLLGTATTANGTWTYATALGAGTHALHAVATDPSGHTASSAAQPAIVVETSAPTVAITAQAIQGASVTLSGTVGGAQGTVVQVRDHDTVLGTATLDGVGGWSYTTTFAGGKHALQAVAMDPAGNSATASASVSVTSPSAAQGSDVLVLTMSEDAYQGDAKFTVAVDGVQIGGVNSVSASHAAGQSQAFVLAGSFAAGSHDVAINFVNDAWGGATGLDRNLYVGAITLNGTTTVGGMQAEGGIQHYQAVAGTRTAAAAAGSVAWADKVGITGKAFTAKALAYDNAGRLASTTFGGVSGQAYSAHQDAYANGLFAGSTYTFSTVSAAATYQWFATDYDFRNTYQGASFHYTGITGQTYTGEDVAVDASGTATSVMLTGITGQPYQSMELDYAGGTYTGYRTFSTGITGQSYTGLEQDVTASGQLTRTVYTGLTGTPYSILEQDYANGVLSRSTYTYTGVAGQSYGSFAVTQDAAGAQLSQTLNNTDGSHTILGFADNLILDSIGNDTMTASGAAETFSFKNVFGSDTIIGFAGHATGAGHDTIELQAADFGDFSKVLASAQTVGAGVAFKGLSGSQITIAGLDKATLAGLGADFVFRA